MNPSRRVLTRTGIAVLMVAGLARAAVAQQPAPPTPPSEHGRVDVDRLPLDLYRIERQLRQSTVREEHEGLNLRYLVDVYGKAPRIELFSREDNLVFGPAPYGAPTHRDMIDIVTPKEHSAPAADFSSFVRWLQEKLK